MGVEFFLFSTFSDKSGESEEEEVLSGVFRLLLEEEEVLAEIFLLKGVEDC